ncbi:MAG: hypothetical protein E6R03_11440 [Hyphomicrobiaceae bacterium]|nr:MAG: hypothetical protein E6R03_11440 [Hyphomicrobiaceae bacterium]
MPSPTYRPGALGQEKPKKPQPRSGSDSPYFQLMQAYQNSTGTSPPEDVAAVLAQIASSKNAAMIQTAIQKVQTIGNQVRGWGDNTAGKFRELMGLVPDSRAQSAAAYAQYANNQLRQGKSVPGYAAQPGNLPSYTPASSSGTRYNASTGTSAGGGYDLDRIIKELQQQTSNANSSNENRYDQMLSNNDAARQEMLGTITGSRDTQLGTIRDSYDKIFGLIGSGEATALEREGKRQANELGTVGQSTIDRGLANTTIADSLRRGVIDDSALRQREIQAQTDQQRMGVQQAYGNAMLGAQQQYGNSLLGTQQYLYGDRNQIIGNRTDAGPDMASWMNLLSQSRYGNGGSGAVGASSSNRPTYNPYANAGAVNNPSQAAAAFAGSGNAYTGPVSFNGQIGQARFAGQGNRSTLEGTLPNGVQASGGRFYVPYSGPDLNQVNANIQAQQAAANQQAWQDRQNQLMQAVSNYYQSREMAGTAPWQGGRTTNPQGALNNFVGNLRGMSFDGDMLDGSRGMANAYPSYRPASMPATQARPTLGMGASQGPSSSWVGDRGFFQQPDYLGYAGSRIGAAGSGLMRFF